MQEIHIRPGVVVDLGIIDNTKENEVSIWPSPQEDKINLEFLSFNEGKNLEPTYSPSSNSEFDERPRDIPNKGENIEYITHIEIWFQEGTKP